MSGSGGGTDGPGDGRRGLPGFRRLRRVIRPDPEREVEEEMAFHFEQRVRDYVARGLSEEEARAAALERLGDVATARREAAAELRADRRAETRHRGLHVSWLEVKLGLRMLVKYPGLSIVGGLGMAVAIAIGAGAFGVITAITDPSLPVEDGDRVVMLQSWDRRIGNPNRGANLHDLETWRAEAETVVDLGAYRSGSRNLVSGSGQAEPVRVAEVTASGFRVTRTAPILGRTLLPEDELPGAPPVLVIGEDVWRERFGADPEIVGREVRLGSTVHTVVGVMPSGFRFPVSHQFWVPLRLDPDNFQRGSAPWVDVFGRLAPGVGFDEARAELTTIHGRLASEYPDVYEPLRVQVLPYTHPFFDIDSPEIVWAFHAITALISLLLVVVAVNIAILVYARTAARMGEIAVRSALGASRRRLVTQLFVEALVLSAAAAAVGLAVAGTALRWIDHYAPTFAGGELPYWLEFGLSPGMASYAAGLAVLAGVIVGVLPALKATGRRVRAGLQHLGTGASGMNLGRTWTFLIVAQVAVAVVLLPPAVHEASEALRYRAEDPSFPSGEFLVALMGMDRDGTVPTDEADAYERAFRARFGETAAEVMRRLEGDARVADATYSLYPPGSERRVWVEIEGLTTPESDYGGVRHGRFGHTVHFNAVATDYFQTHEVAPLAGRIFGHGDDRAAATAVIVNRSFVERYLGGLSVLGRHIRYIGVSGDASPDDVELDRWLQIVGVVPDFPTSPVAGDERLEPVVYHAAAPGVAYPLALSVRVRGAPPATFAGRMRGIVMETDATVELHDVKAWEQRRLEARGAMRLVAVGIAIAVLSVVLLSGAGIYALMSFTVARRRREIGIRSALGATPARLLGGVFARAALQLGLGVTVGLGITWLLDRGAGRELMGGNEALLLPGVALVMVAVGLLAAAGPARRGLAVEPSEALRSE